MVNKITRRECLLTVSAGCAAGIAGCSETTEDEDSSENDGKYRPEKTDTTDTEQDEMTTDRDGKSNGVGNTTEDIRNESTVEVGPEGQLIFEPAEITVETGETVIWEFHSATHNVSAWPDHSDEVSLPDGAEGFGTMEKDGNVMETVAVGETFEHTFETPGVYTYVCVPHVATDMIGTVIVE